MDLTFVTCFSPFRLDSAANSGHRDSPLLPADCGMQARGLDVIFRDWIVIVHCGHQVVLRLAAEHMKSKDTAINAVVDTETTMLVGENSIIEDLEANLQYGDIAQV